MSELSFAFAEFADYPRILEIYNWAVDHSSATFDMEHQTLQSKGAWLAAHNDRYPLIVAKIDNVIIGWASINQWSTKAAYDGLAEISIYLHPDFHNKGYGTLLLQYILDLGKSRNFRSLVSQISHTAQASLHIHRQLGFVDTGVLRLAGVKFGEVVDVLILQFFYTGLDSIENLSPQN